MNQLILPSRFWYIFLPGIFILFCGNSAPAQTKSKSELICDTIRLTLNEASNDTAKLHAALTKIRRCRRKIGNNYEPFLEDFILKASHADYQYGLMKAYDFLGLQKRYNESYDEAIMLHQRSLEIAKLLGDTLQMCYNYNNLGQAYRKQDLNILALPYFHKALAMQELLGNDKSASFTHNTLGATYLAQNELDKASYHLEKSNQIAERRNDKRTMAFNYGMLGEIQLMRNEPDEALPLFEKALIIKEELNYDKGIAVTLHLMAQAYYQKGDYKKAESIFNQAIAIHRRYKNKRYLSLCYAYIGKIQIAQQKYSQAEKSLTKAKDMANDVHSIEQLVLIHEAFTQLYKTSDNWPLAYTHLKASNAWKDSLNAAKYQKQIQNLEIDYQTQQKEQQIEILSSANEIKTQRIRLGIAIIALLLISLAFVFYMLSVRKKNAQQQEEKLRQQLLKSQMNPHFIFNALGSIQNYMYRNKPETAARYMGNFAKLTRSILNNSSNDKITLDEEIETLTHYLELEQMRMKDTFQYQINFSEDLETELIHVPPMLLQPFIENSIKHGIKNMHEGALITLSFSETDDFICANIEDNGIGINQSANSNNKLHKSLATEIFKQRMAIIKNNYPALPQPVIKDLSDENKSGTLVTVYLPILN
ncbi:tetratricopeptide repeat protein [Carboxylicivirga sp. A043]|uniref:tetratricopeptide repeat-containing sensor histidine kinase n=1 Tax=Carboxylicivirga litoralis TaxID=2816963 RepID=UPI0021CB7031|nr:tetratricopeptide repeat protein [Carboxylicivirga sp. A043]MCU4155609.1 tetratricopeptide repeat protein [Carboxylicivirga sp. A043]